MPQVAIPFPLSTQPGTRPAEGGGRLINYYAEPLGDERTCWRRVPGLKTFLRTANTTFRGFLLNGGSLIVVWQGVLQVVTSGAVIIAGANLPGDQRVFMARNNKAPSPDVAIVTENGAFLYAGGAITAWPDLDLPSPADVTFLDGYFFFMIGDGRCFASGINDTTIDSNAYITTESHTDQLLRGVPWNGLLLLFSTASIEAWADTAEAPPAFPFSRSAVIPVGLAGPYAIAGWEDGFGGNLLFVADDNSVRRMAGFDTQKVSPPDLDGLIEQIADKSTLEAECYVARGHLFWSISSPYWTWVFDLNTQKWHERRSYGSNRWRATQSINAFGMWLTGDTANGDISQIDTATLTEVDQPIETRIESANATAFPRRMAVGRADFNFVTGVGVSNGLDPIQTNPAVWISWSDDGGSVWSTPLTRPLGKQGETSTQVTVYRTGMTGAVGRRWAIEQADPCHLALLGGTMNADPRA